MKRVFQYGIRVYVEIKSLGFDDRTLRDCLGMVAAALLSLMATENSPDGLLSKGSTIEESVHAHIVKILKAKEHIESL